MRKITILILSFLIGNLVFSKTFNNPLEIPIQYESVEIKPLFPGGISEFMKFVMKNYQVPEDEEGGGETGTVQVSIVIDVDGSVAQVTIVKDVGNAGKEIKRVLSKCPKWTPGRQKGINVPVVYNFPITIK
ncbi:energy transducer TonB [Flavobacterium sp.]|uniref:energy transducer TonB n=1 Tax=Flavobacterium sp. TaxID=239 RepID=UPI003D6A87A3